MHCGNWTKTVIYSHKYKVKMKTKIFLILLIPLVALAATKNIVPRAAHEGSIGTVLKPWNYGNFDSTMVDTARITDGMYLRATLLDSIWNSGDSLLFRVNGVARGFAWVSAGGATPYDSASVSANSHLIQGKDTVWIKSLGGTATNADSLNHKFPDFGVDLLADSLAVKLPLHALADSSNIAKTSITSKNADSLNHYFPDFNVSLMTDSLAVKLPLHALADSSNLAKSATNAKNADSLNHYFPDFPVSLMTDSLAQKLKLHGLADSSNVSKLSWSADSVDHLHPDFGVNLLTDSLAVKLPLHALADSANVSKLAWSADSVDHVHPDFPVNLITDSLAVKLPIAGKAADATVADSSRGGAVRLAGYTPDFPVSLMTDSLAVKLPIAGKAADATVADSSRGGAVRLAGYTPDFPVSLMTDSLAVKIPTAQKAAASGVASLNASTLVVENPANATATPTASKIVIADAGGKVDSWITAASDIAAGKVELATIAETNTGTDAARSVTPDGLSGSIHGQVVLEIYLFAGATALATGDGKGYIYIAPKLNGMNIVSVCASLIGAASSSGTPTIQIARGRQPNATTIYSYNDVLSTLITIDANEWSCKDATTPPVINATYDDLLTGDMLRFDVDGAGTGATGLIVEVTCQIP